jgi:hypothetical protein
VTSHDRCPHGYPARIDGSGIGCPPCKREAQAARDARDRGMIAAESRPGADWDRAVIDRLIGHHAASGEPFSVNHIRPLLPAVAGPLIGARFRAAASRGEIELIGTVLASHEAGHCRRVGLWRGRRQPALFERAQP